MKALLAALTIAFLATMSSTAEANPILELKVTQPSGIGVGFDFFASSTDKWPGGLPSGIITTAHGMGTLDDFIDLPVSDLSDIYITASGDFETDPSRDPDVFVAEPPTGHVSDATAFAFGPPWISLAGLGPHSPLSGDLWIINGSPYDGSWLVGTWQVSEVSAVPEPATWLLFGTGLGLAAMRRYRQDARAAAPAARI